MRIGVDFDNTLVGYDHLFADSARRRGWTDVPLGKGKKILRDALRARADGDRDWCSLQAEVYGARMAEARLFDGAARFLRCCRDGSVAVYIVSHKTRFAAADPGGVDLRAASLDWMRSQGFFREDHLGLSPSQVFFEASRAEKLARIAALGCTHFIDDLEEVLLAPEFPKGVKRYLIGACAVTSVVSEVRSFKDWQGITDDIFGRDQLRERDSRLIATVAALAGERVVAFKAVGVGGNNRVYRACLGDGRRLAAKCYPSQKEDPRDRLGTEFGGLAFLVGKELARALPCPVAADYEAGVALYEWIAGEAVSATDPGVRHSGDVDQALDLLASLHRLRLAPGADDLLPGSEPCFSGATLASGITARRRRLGEVAGDHEPLREFLLSRFDSVFEQAVEKAERKYAAADMSFTADIAKRDHTLSPSDFGFHNARRRTDGSLVFLDFEYFGWDDPVKLTADILLHPGMTLSAEEEDRFRRGLADIYRGDVTYGSRLATLWPLFGLRWCLILLNEFLPERWFRRAYADAGLDHATTRARQLDKAEGMLRRVCAEEEE